MSLCLYMSRTWFESSITSPRKSWKKEVRQKKIGTNPSEERGMWQPRVVIPVFNHFNQSRNHKGGGVCFNLSALKAVVLVNLSVIIVNLVNMFF